jgi:hypothetical protein
MSRSLLRNLFPNLALGFHTRDSEQKVNKR